MSSVHLFPKSGLILLSADGRKRGFTLVEMLVSLTILVIIMGLLFVMTQQTASVYKNTNGKIEAFRDARGAFESMTRNLSLAALNNYYAYNSTTAPTAYLRTSDLHFISGWYTSNLLYNKQVTHSVFFQAPLGYTNTPGYQNLGNLLNACGYYIQYQQDPSVPAGILPTTYANPYRYRLMEFIQPTENLTVYNTFTSGAASETAWFNTPLASTTPYTHQLAPNIIALIILPRDGSGNAAGSANTSLVSDYQYDSRGTSPTIANQLPPIVEVVMVAMDEASAARMGNTSTQPTVISTALNGLFQKSSLLDSDLGKLENSLIAGHIIYRVFQTLVPMHSSKWSNE